MPYQRTWWSQLLTLRLCSTLSLLDSILCSLAILSNSSYSRVVDILRMHIAGYESDAMTNSHDYHAHLYYTGRCATRGEVGELCKVNIFERCMRTAVWKIIMDSSSSLRGALWLVGSAVPDARIHYFLYRSPWMPRNACQWGISLGSLMDHSFVPANISIQYWAV